MISAPNKLSKFIQELKRRKVLPFLIAYVAGCFAIIGFFLDASETFSLPQETIRLLYLLSAIGIPVVILLPWIINRKKDEETEAHQDNKTETPKEKETKPLHNLPAQLTNFIGRKEEMITVKALIKDHRLVTFTGAGGCGKTRMACEVAIQLVDDFRDGIWFVDLAPILNEDRILLEISETLAITEVADQALIDTIIETIKDKELTIILDNCEHMIKTCAEVSGKLIQSAPKIKILATSRESLGIIGEKVWTVPSLTLLDPKAFLDLEQVKNSEAVMLFNDRARLNNPEFELETENISEVVNICNKVDGIPLALELVASRTRYMDPGMILERFSEQFEKITSIDPRTSNRHQTLQTTIEWSYNLLSDSERLLFERLSVFSGGLDITAAEEVCSDDLLPKEIILDTLSRLVDQSLVYTRKASDKSTRYNCLSIIKQFAHQAIKNRNEEDYLNKKHLQYYLALAEEAYQEQYENQLQCIDKLDTEEDNLMAALEWSEDSSPKDFCWLAGSLAWYWYNRMKLVLGKQHLETAHSIETGKLETQARVIHGLGWFQCMFNDYERGIVLIKESLSIWRSLDNLQEQAFVLAQLGSLMGSKISDLETRLSYCDQGLEIAHQLGKPGFINHCLHSICQVLIHSKQFKRGLPYVEELIESSEKLQQPSGIMGARHYHSDCALAEKDYKEAEKRYALGINLGMKYGNHWIAFADMQGVAFSLAGQRRWKKSLLLDAASVEKSRTMGVAIYGMLEFWDEWIDSFIAGAKKEVGEDLAKQYEEEGIAMGFEKAVEYALDFEKD